MPLEAGMVVEMMIPEASLNKIFKGMPAKAKIDAFPGRIFKGKLNKIGILPDAQSSQLNPGLKLYKCEVECDFKDIIVRPGMSCDVELITETHEDALYIPVQCVVRVDDQPRIYIQDGGKAVSRNVEIGLDNNTMVHILSGIKEGDVIMLAPPVAEEIEETFEEDEEEKPEHMPEDMGANGEGEEVASDDTREQSGEVDKAGEGKIRAAKAKKADGSKKMRRKSGKSEVGKNRSRQ